MTSVKDEITIDIGNLIGQEANNSGEPWDYAGYVFSFSVTTSTSWNFFVFSNKKLLDIDDDSIWKKIKTNFERLREITRVDGDDYWIRCLAVVRNETKEFRMLFEFDNHERWEITPENARQSYEILVGEIFPEALE